MLSITRRLARKQPDGMRRRIADEAPKWRDIIAKAEIKAV
jgi:hypothetical protein